MKMKTSLTIAALALTASLTAVPVSACPCYACVEDECTFGYGYGGSVCEEDIGGGGCIFTHGYDCKCPWDEDIDDGATMAFASSTTQLTDGTIVSGKRVSNDAFSIRSCSGQVFGVVYDPEAAKKRRELARRISLD